MFEDTIRYNYPETLLRNCEPLKDNELNYIKLLHFETNAAKIRTTSSLIYIGLSYSVEIFSIMTRIKLETL